MKENNGKRKPPPHHRLTFNDVVRDYQDGLLTAKGAIFYAISSVRKQGDPVKISPSQLTDTLGMTTRSYYKSVAALKLMRRVDFEVEGTMTLKVPIDETSGNPEYIFLKSLGTKIHSEGTKIPNLGTEIHSEGTKIPNLGTEIHSEGTKIPNLGTEIHKKDSKAFCGKDSGTLQSIQSIQSLSLSEQIEGERETEIEEKFRNWLRDRANLLPERPVLLERWIDSEAKKESNKKEFLSYLDSLHRTNIPPAAAAFQKIPDELQQAIADCDRDRAYELIRENPMWGLTIGEVAQLLGGRNGEAS